MAPSLEKVEGAHWCIWAAGKVGAGDIHSCMGSQGQQEQNCGALAQFLFNLVLGADGVTNSACPWFVNVVFVRHWMLRALEPAVKLLGK